MQHKDLDMPQLSHCPLLSTLLESSLFDNDRMTIGLVFNQYLQKNTHATRMDQDIKISPGSRRKF
jgi:hypothetical protein